MAPPIRAKGFLEVRNYPNDLSALMSVGSVLTSVQMTASLMAPFPLQSATLFAPVAIGDPTIQLSATANPGKGALLIIEPGTGAEETVKVKAISGASSPFTATIDPVTWETHPSGAAVSYEPGRNARLFVNDTPIPAGSTVMASIRKGSYGQKYRISYLAVANDLQRLEDEFTLDVSDIATVETNIKQPYEERDMAGDFEKVMAEPHQAGATLSSPVAYVSSNTNTGTAQLTTPANPGATTISLNAHPGIGAMLILTPAGTGNTPPERAYVSNVTGTVSPFTVTLVQDLEFTHSGDVTVFRGYTGAFLVSSVGTVSGQQVINRARRGAAGKALKVVWTANTSQAEVLQVTAVVQVTEE